MATATAPTPVTIALKNIHVPQNVRDLDPDHVAALAGSIELLGMLVPLVLRHSEKGYELVAGFHRHAAAEKAGLSEVPIVVRDGDTEEADRAVENIARKQLNPYEEARAVDAMLKRGLTQDGAAQVLGWSRQLVSARVKMLALPEQAQRMIGAGTLSLSCVDQLLSIGSVSGALLDALIAYLDSDAGGHALARFTSQPGWALGQALREMKADVFAAYLNGVTSMEITQLRLGKKTDAPYKEAERLHRQADQYAYGPPRVSFGDAHIDQARAAGVLIEFAHGEAPIIVDRALYRELAKDAVKQTVQELQAKVATVAAQKKTQRSKTPADPATQARRERDAQLRELADQAHGINLTLGSSLLNGLACVDPGDIDVARFFVYALLGADPDQAGYGHAGEGIQRIAIAGVRLMLAELRSDVTKTRKDGSRGRLRIQYAGDPKDSLRWLWKFIDGASTAGELYGRALVILAAEQHASRLVLPTSKRIPPNRWPSHKDRAGKALAKLAGPHLPASLTQLERAVARTHRAYQQAQSTARKPDTTGSRVDVDDAVEEETTASADEPVDTETATHDVQDLDVDDELPPEDDEAL